MNQRGLVVFFLLSLVFVSSFVAAEAGTFGESVQNFVQGTTDIFEPLLKPLLGDTGSGSSDVFLAKILLFFAYFAVVWSVVTRVPVVKDKIWVGYIVSVVVAILGIRYLTPDAILAGAFSSSATVLALFIFTSFAVFFFVIQTGVTLPLLRKLAWIILAACYIGLFATYGYQNMVTRWIYLVAVALSVGAFLLDGTIQSLFNRARVESQVRASGTESYENLLVKLEAKKQAYLSALGRGSAGAARAAILKQQVKDLENALAEAAKFS